MKPSRASGYSKSDDRAPAVRGAAHRAQSSIRDVDSRRGRRGQGGKAPPTFTSIREGALRRPRRPQKDRILVACRVRRRRA